MLSLNCFMIPIEDCRMIILEMRVLPMLPLSHCCIRVTVFMILSASVKNSAALFTTVTDISIAV